MPPHKPLHAKSSVKSGNMLMPVIGLGTWNNIEESAIESALELGYRHFDTAYAYCNEALLGKVLARWMEDGRVTRDQLFITTKLPSFANRSDMVERMLQKSLEALQLDYVDLYLIHSPMGYKYLGDDVIFPMEDGKLLWDHDTDILAIWHAMEEQALAGRAKSIGVSNFSMKQLERILHKCRIPPVNNQVEMHVYFQRPALREFCERHDITICAYAPLGSPGMPALVKALVNTDIEIPSPLKDPVILEIAEKHKKTPGAILLRFLLQLRVAVIPKSSNPERQKENFNVFNFELGVADMTKLKALHKGQDGRMFGPEILQGAEDHPECPLFED